MSDCYEKAIDVTSDLGSVANGSNLELLYDNTALPNVPAAKKKITSGLNTGVYALSPNAIMITDATVSQEKIEVIPLRGGPSVTLYLTVNEVYDLAIKAIVKRSDTTAKAVIILGNNI